jgi:hypothetical protein
MRFGWLDWSTRHDRSEHTIMAGTGHMRSRAGIALILVALLLAGHAASGQPAAALPDPATFLAAVRANLFADEEIARHYTYHERREEIRVSKLGNVSVGRVRLFEVYASPDPLHRYRRLIADDDVPLSTDELKRRDGAYGKYLADLALEREHETPAAQNARLAREAAERRKRDDLVDDVFGTFEMALLRRDMTDGRPSIVVSLTPRNDVRTKSSAGKYLRKFRGTVWIDEADRQLVRAELECLDTILVGWGLLGRVHKGSRVTFDRVKVNDEVWLPRSFRTEVKGRALLVRTFDVTAETRYSDYRRFSVVTRETFEPPSR